LSKKLCSRHLKTSAPLAPVSRKSIWLLVSICSGALCWLFWWPLCSGGGLVGGDLYPYYMPQKVFFSESLRSGTLPLWNSLVGFGYPILGESQTGALYPPNLVLFSLFDVNTAYNISQLGHYLLAFFGAFCLSRRWGLRIGGSLLAATAFVYGWFPARICLEWAILGGAWFVWILWAATAFLQTGRRKYCLLTALFLGLDLLAGHYNLAFITLLTLIPFPWMVSPEQVSEQVPNRVEQSTDHNAVHWPRWLGLVTAVTAGFLIAAVQIFPTWELKSLSPRQTDSDVFVPTNGHLPIRAISQLWMPWAWSGGDVTMDESLAACHWLTVPSVTNQVEAQLYVGLLTFLLAILVLIHPRFSRENRLLRPWGWLLLAACSLLLATGWPTYLLPWMPGLNFFRGPGRYSMTAALALSLLGGAGLDAVLKRLGDSLKTRQTLVAGILLFTAGDLWAASRQYDFGISPYLGRNVFYAVMVNAPPVKWIPESTLRHFFQKEKNVCRLYAPGANLPTLLGVSALPVYLGLGPKIYESPAMQVDFQTHDSEVIAEQARRLRDFGVTHLLLEAPLDRVQDWPVIDLGAWGDRLLGTALGKPTPFHLYALRDAPGRVFIEGPDHHDHPNRILQTTIEPNRVRIEVECHSDCRLVLKDLDAPGWQLRSPQQASIHQASIQTVDLFRSVELKAVDSEAGRQTVEWIYRPASVYFGGILSLLTLAGAAFIGIRGLPARQSNRK